ncbi:MAG TPA: thioesterase family protein [Solirubrobacteraceae bacterium]
MNPFDADTAIEAAGERRWRGQVSERWYVGRGANGGLLAAQCVRAMQALAGDPERVPRSLTVHFLEAPVAGPIEIAGTIERAGRSTTAVSLRLEQGERTVGLALGALARWRDGGREHLAVAPPRVPRPDALAPLDPATSGLPAFVANYDWRWAVEEGGHAARVGGWIRTAEPRAVDHVALAAFADAFPPAVFPLIGGTAPAPTIDLTIHFRAPLDGLGEGWILGAFASRRLAGGFFEEDGELWSEDGRLLVQSRQLAMLREPPA